MNVIPALRPELTAPPPGLPALVACDWLEERGATLGEVLWGWAGGTVGQEMLAEWLRRVGDYRLPLVVNDCPAACPIALPPNPEVSSWSANFVCERGDSILLTLQRACEVRGWIDFAKFRFDYDNQILAASHSDWPKGAYRFLVTPIAGRLYLRCESENRRHAWHIKWDSKTCEADYRWRVLSLFREVEVTIDVAGAPRIIDAPQFLREVNGMYVRLPPGWPLSSGRAEEVGRRIAEAQERMWLAAAAALRSRE